MSDMLAERKNDKVLVDENLYNEFARRYGVRNASNLIIFYHQCKEYGDGFLRLWYNERTYYRYRHRLVRDGYLQVDEFLGKGGGPAFIM